ncbi:UpxY family transcription antiterminator [Pontibacter litorisediminis]|uniref:UpxY family transcription antiterminator n=1 Tax=Pontibacter litorisediminis TaxID=1846260 RepID=UPI0023ECFAB5|nr:UpxY family transcription antiterminator [Pontibacter litorisediminis]
MTEKWYAVYTKPRWEKRVAQTLTMKNLNAYCPINQVIRQWSDRKKIVLAPLFTSYVFVRITEKQICEVKKTEGVVNLVYWLGKPASIEDEEIETIKRFLNEHQNVQLKKIQFSINEKVRVTTGHLIDKEGVVVAIKNNTIKVALPSLNYLMYAEISTSSAAKIDSLNT